MKKDFIVIAYCEWLLISIYRITLTTSTFPNEFNFQCYPLPKFLTVIFLSKRDSYYKSIAGKKEISPLKSSYSPLSTIIIPPRKQMGSFTSLKSFLHSKTPTSIKVIPLIISGGVEFPPEAPMLA